MSSDAPSDRPAGDRPTEPFARGRIQWSRPPQPVFHVGPLPRGEGISAPPPRPAAGILSGSMIPQARSEAAPPPEPIAEPEPIPAPEPEALVAPTSGETLIEPDEPEPVTTVPPPLSDEAPPRAEPRSLPSVVVTPAIYAQVGAAFQKAAARSDKRMLVLAGVGVIAVIGGFIWLATLPAPQPVDAVGTAATPEVAVQAPAAAEVAPAAVAAPPPVVRAASPLAAPPAPAPAARPAPRPTPRVAAPVVEVPAEPAPLAIETAPLVVEPPTPATPPPASADAPISTQPQPLD